MAQLMRILSPLPSDRRCISIVPLPSSRQPLLPWHASLPPSPASLHNPPPSLLLLPLPTLPTLHSQSPPLPLLMLSRPTLPPFSPTPWPSLPQPLQSQPPRRPAGLPALPQPLPHLQRILLTLPCLPLLSPPPRLQLLLWYSRPVAACLSSSLCSPAVAMLILSPAVRQLPTIGQRYFGQR